MGEVSKDLLREKIKRKRAPEGLDDIPQEEQSAKKPKYDVSVEEQKKVQERRTRNKEAAEKSRKKKKEEFEKLQSENDQLNQDKCELAAMIETLKKQNFSINIQLDHLKRWIAKRVDVFGLQKKECSPLAKSPQKSEVLWDDPPLHRAEICVDETVPTTTEKSLNTSALSYSATASESSSPLPDLMGTDEIQAVGVKMMKQVTPQHRDLLAPWLIEQPSAPSAMTHDSLPIQAEKKKEGKNNTVTTVTSPPAPAPAQTTPIQPQPVRAGENQQVLYMPSPFVVMQGKGGQQVLMPAQQLQFVYGPPQPAGILQTLVKTPPPVFMAAPKMNEVRAISSANGISGGNVADGITAIADVAVKAEKMTVAQDKGATETAIGEEEITIPTRDPSVATAIESLLKLGFKIELPGDGKNTVPSANVPLDDPQSFPAIAVGTTSDMKMGRNGYKLITKSAA